MTVASLWLISLLNHFDEIAYLATNDGVHRFNMANQSHSSLLSLSSVRSLAYAPSYGGSEQAGLYVLKDYNDELSQLCHIPLESLPDNVSRCDTYTQINKATDVAFTADGGLMLAKSYPALLRDTRDERFSYQEWLRDEYEQYITMMRTVLWPDGKAEGWVNGDETSEGTARHNYANAGAAGWAVIIMIADQAMFDRDWEQEVTLILERHGGLAADGIVPEQTPDGFFF